MAVPVLGEDSPTPAEVVVSGHGLTQRPAPPYRWYDFCEQKTKGTSPVLIGRLLEELNLTMRMVPVKSAERAYRGAQAVDMLRRREVDLVPLVGEQYRKEPDLVMGQQPLMDLKLVIISRDRSFPRDLQLNALEGLSGRVSSLGYRTLVSRENWDSSNLQPLPAGSWPWAELISGDLDYYIGEHYNSILAIEGAVQAGMPADQLKVSPLNITAARFFLAALNEGPYRDLITQVDELLVVYHQQGLVDYMHQGNIRHWVKGKRCAIPQKSQVVVHPAD